MAYEVKITVPDVGVTIKDESTDIDPTNTSKDLYWKTVESVWIAGKDRNGNVVSINITPFVNTDELEDRINNPE